MTNNNSDDNSPDDELESFNQEQIKSITTKYHGRTPENIRKVKKMTSEHWLEILQKAQNGWTIQALTEELLEDHGIIITTGTLSKKLKLLGFHANKGYVRSKLENLITLDDKIRQLDEQFSLEVKSGNVSNYIKVANILLDYLKTGLKIQGINTIDPKIVNKTTNRTTIKSSGTTNVQVNNNLSSSQQMDYEQMVKKYKLAINNVGQKPTIDKSPEQLTSGNDSDDIEDDNE